MSQLKDTLSCAAASALPEPDPVFEQRKQNLYPADLARTRLDLRMVKCQARDTPNATALRKKLLGNRLPGGAWQDAVSDCSADRLRALLLVLDERELVTELARPLFNSPLQQARANPGLETTGWKTVAKQYPYFPTKWRERGWPVAPRNFNLAPINCRHLAMHHLLQMASNPDTIKSQLHTAFGSLETIRNTVNEDQMQRQFEALCTRASASHMVSNARFGDFLTTQFRDMESAGTPTRTMLLASTNHAMSVGLRIKQVGNRSVYVVKVFDPNRTTHHGRSRTSDLATLSGMPLSDWLDGDQVSQQYYPEANAISTLFVVNPADQIDQTTLPRPVPGRTLTSLACGPETDATVMHTLLRHGYTGNLEQLEAQFATLPDDQKITALAAKNGNGVPGLYFALQDGHAATMPVFSRLLAQVPEESRTFLPAAWNASETPGLFLALDNGHADLLRAYCAPLQLVPEAHRAFLLAAKVANGLTGLSLTFLKGHAEAIRAYAAPLALVPQHQRASLAAAKNGIGEPGVLVALRKGHTEAIRAFRALLELVPPEERACLLPDVDHDAQPGTGTLPTSQLQAAIAAYEALRLWNRDGGHDH